MRSTIKLRSLLDRFVHGQWIGIRTPLKARLHLQAELWAKLSQNGVSGRTFRCHMMPSESWLGQTVAGTADRALL